MNLFDRVEKSFNKIGAKSEDGNPMTPANFMKEYKNDIEQMADTLLNVGPLDKVPLLIFSGRMMHYLGRVNVMAKDTLENYHRRAMSYLEQAQTMKE